MSDKGGEKLNSTNAIPKKKAKKRRPIPLAIFPAPPLREQMSVDSPVGTPPETIQGCQKNTLPQSQLADALRKLAIDTPSENCPPKIVKEFPVESPLRNSPVKAVEGFPEVSLKANLAGNPAGTRGEYYKRFEKLGILITFDPARYCVSDEINKNKESRKLFLPVPEVTFLNVKLGPLKFKSPRLNGTDLTYFVEEIPPKATRKLRTEVTIYSSFYLDCDTAPPDHWIHVCSKYDPVVFLNPKRSKEKDLVVIHPNYYSKTRKLNEPKRVIMIDQDADFEPTDPEPPKQWFCLNPESFCETSGQNRVFIVNPKWDLAIMRSQPPLQKIRATKRDGGEIPVVELTIVTKRSVVTDEAGRSPKSNNNNTNANAKPSSRAQEAPQPEKSIPVQGSVPTSPPSSGMNLSASIIPHEEVLEDEHFIMNLSVYTPELGEFVNYEAYGTPAGKV